MSKYILLSLLSSLLAFPAVAQIADDYGTTEAGTYCPTLSVTMQRGARDVSTQNQVSELQKFLSDYFDVDPTELVTGFFGRITQGYVIKFQKEQGLPAFGIAGQMTRGVIARVCQQVSGVQPTTPATITLPHVPPVPGSSSITLFAAKDPNPTTRSVMIVWQASANIDVNLDVECTPGTISFITDKGNSPGCEKGGVWSWYGQTSGSISVTPVGNTNSLTLPFTLTKNGTGQSQKIYITFPAPTNTAFQVLPLKMDNNGPAFAGQSYTVAWTSGSGNANQLISCSVTPVAGGKDGSLGQTYLAQGSLAFTMPTGLISGNYYIFCGNQSGALYAKGPAFAVQGLDTAPKITSTSAKAAGNLEMDAGGQAYIHGSSFTSGNVAETVRVFIGGVQAEIFSYSDTMLSINVPSSLVAGTSYDLYVVRGGASNILRVKILSNLTATPKITSATASGGAVSISGSNLNSGGNPAIRFSLNGTQVGWVYFISMNKISSENLSFNVSNGINGLKDGQIVSLSSGTYQVAVHTDFGGVSNEFPLTITTASQPSVVGTFTHYSQGNDSFSGYTYQIQNYRSGVVLDVEPKVNCNDTNIAPARRDCSQYLFNLSGKAAESYTNVKANPFVAGGALYRFTGSNGQLNLNGFVNPSYVILPHSNTIKPMPDSIDFKFILRDSKSGEEFWSETKTAGFKG